METEVEVEVEGEAAEDEKSVKSNEWKCGGSSDRPIVG